MASNWRLRRDGLSRRPVATSDVSGVAKYAAEPAREALSDLLAATRRNLSGIAFCRLKAGSRDLCRRRFEGPLDEGEAALALDLCDLRTWVSTGGLGTRSGDSVATGLSIPGSHLTSPEYSVLCDS